VGQTNNRTAAIAGWSVFLALALLAAGGMWYYVLHSHSLNESDFTAVNATLTSYEEKPSGKNRFLEFHVAEHPAIRFRVPADGYESSFDRQAFFRNVKPGSRITFKVEKGKLQNPDRPPLDPTPTVFVHEVRDDQATYGTLAGRKEWEEQNQRTGKMIALFLTLLAGGAAVGLVWTVAARQPVSGADAWEDRADGPDPNPDERRHGFSEEFRRDRRR
jgi:hypothetical protein